MKHVLFILIPALFLITLSAFLPIEKICNNENILGEMEYFFFSGYESLRFQMGTLLVAIALSIAFFGNGKNYLSYFLLILLLYISSFGFISIINIAGWGRPCGVSITSYFWLMILGHFGVLLFSGLYSAHKNKKNMEQNTDF